MVVLFLTLTNCQKDDTIILQEARVKFTAPSIFDAKNNFLQKSTLNVKDVNTILQSRDLQTSLTVDWELSKTKKYKDEPNQEVDILYTPIYINNDAQAKMFIGSVEHNGAIESNLFCLIYTDIQNTTSFSGYFLRFNLDGILLDAKKYNNGVIIEPSNQGGGSLGRSSNSECTDFSQLLECLLDYFGGDLDLSFWHLGGLLDQVVVTASIDAGPSGSGGTDSSLTSPFNIPYIDNDISSTGGSSSIGLSWWSTSYVTANPFNILQWLEIHPITPQGQFLLNEASSDLLQDIANFLNDNMYRIRDEFPDLDGFDPVNNNNANTGYGINEEATDFVEAILDAANNNTLITAFPFVKYPDGSNYANDYPNLTEYLKVELPKIAEDDLIVQALMQYGSLTEEQIREKLTWGKGPVVKLSYLSSTHSIIGRFNGLPVGTDGAHEGPETLELNIYTFAEIEQSIQNGGDFDSKTLSFFIAICILHEMTHYGDFHYNGNLFNSSGEPGIDFETFVFGSIIDYPEGLGIVQEYLIKKQD